MHRLHLLIFVFGIIWSGFTYAEAEDPDDSARRRGMVLVEPMSIVTSEVKEEYSLLPYRERRGVWGTTVSLGYSSYEPLSYEPDFVAEDFANLYSNPDLPMIEFLFTFKRNFSFGSLGLEIGAGIYENNSDNEELGDSTLKLTPVRGGLILSLDAITAEPFVVPYFGGGMYTMIFNESLGGNSHNGNTEAAPYFHGGVAILLDWIDRAGAVAAFRESGVQSTYAYVEAQKYMEAQAAADGDFSNEVSIAGGVRVEF